VTKTLLFLHLVSAFLLVSGAVVAGVAQISALRRERPSEIALLFRLARPGVLLVNLGALGTLVFGIALVEDTDIGLGTGWVSAALALWVVMMLLGGLGGRSARHARELAERLAAEGDRPSEELRSLVSHRPSLLLSYASTAVIVAILVLMVWKPGS
jgi:uncharacterized membrane protein